MDLKAIIERRAAMDVRQDLQCGELWGEDEIIGDVDEIVDKIRDTAKTLSQIMDDDGDIHELSYLLDKNNRAITDVYVPIWQNAYRVEKAFFIMATRGRRFEKVVRRNKLPEQAYTANLNSNHIDF